LNALHRHVGDVDLTEVSTEAVAAFLAGRGPITATWLNKHRALRLPVGRRGVPEQSDRASSTLVSDRRVERRSRRMISTGARSLHFLYGCFSSSAVQRRFRNIRLLVKRIHSLPGRQ
jgi:hypothetical protein